MRGIFVVFALATVAAAFVPAPNHAGLSVLFRPASSLHSTTKLSAVATIPNPFKKLPWNAKKEQQREARRLKQESAQLHRELGIADDCTYEELTAATDHLIARAGDDVKAKIKIEVAKDRILQIRLNERLAGLSRESKEARAQSNFEVEGVDEDEGPKQVNEWNAPEWTQGLIVKPDRAYAMKQVKFWGGLTLIGVLFPSTIERMSMFTWLLCIGSMQFRGQDMSEFEAFSFSRRGPKGPHIKVAWLLGLALWISSSFVVYFVLPDAWKGFRWTQTLVYAMQNSLYGLACAYLQPYKG